MPVVAPNRPTTAAPFDAARLRANFPILSTLVHNRPLAYLDNGASTQKPRAVIDAVSRYYATSHANIHRAVHHLSQRATEQYEASRRAVAAFLGGRADEVVFTRGTTEAINLVAHSFGQTLKAGDEILLTTLEHHSNIVPWQLAAERVGARVRALPIDDDGEPRYDELPKYLSKRTKIVSFTALSNALGTVLEGHRLVAAAKSVGAKVLVDGAQWVGHLPTDVAELGCDFYVFSGHKLFGPTGTGALWARRELLDQMPPYQGGGDMIRTVSFERSTWADAPAKFEAGTPNIAGAIGLAAAVAYLQDEVDLTKSGPYEDALLAYAVERLESIDGVRIIGRPKRRASAVSFLVDGLQPHDVGVLLDAEGVAVRTGHHCCMPLMDRLGLPGTVRASLAFYNTRADVDQMAVALEKIVVGVRPRVVSTVALEATTPTTDEARAGDDGVKYPDATGPSPKAIADELAETFEFLGDAQERNTYLMELGGKIPRMPDALKNESTRVHGCMSTVHLYARRRPGTRDTVDFVADSDAFIVKGLVGLLQQLFAGQSARAVLAFDVEAFFKRIGLEQHVTTQRRNGLEAMTKRLRALAGAIVREAEGTK